MKFAIACLFFICGFATQPRLNAGELRNRDGVVCTHELKGEIESGDLDKIKAAALGYNNSLCLNSPGGNFIEGVDIAEWLVDHGVKTVIERDAFCYSACAFIFMGGGAFEDGYYGRRELYLGGRLGFHAPYSVPANRSYSSEELSAFYHLGLQSVAKMMTLGAMEGEERGFIPTSIILELLRTPPNVVYEINTGARIRKLGIDLKGTEKVVWTVNSLNRACSSILGFDVDSRWTPVEPEKAIRLDNGGLELWYYGFGAEDSGYCVARVTPGQPPKIAVPVWKEDGALLDSAFLTVEDSDALPFD